MMHKKIYFKLTLMLLIVLTMFVIIKPNKKQEVNVIKEAKEIKSFAIYKDDGSGNYAISSDASFPTKGYILNMDKTKCFDSNNSNVSNSIVNQSLDGKITLSATVSTYCNLYFTKDSTIPVVKSFSITGKDASGADLTNGYTYNNEVTYKIEWLDNDVTHYCLTTNPTSCDQTWVETGGGQSITVKNNTFTSTEGPHTIYVYLKDKAQNVSSTTDISKKTITVDRTAPGVPTFSIMGKTTGGSNLNGDYSQVVGVGTTLTWSGDVKDYCITTSATCSSTEWKSAATTPSITLPSSEGTKTYNAYVRDNANNVSGKATDSIFLDLTNPSVSKVTYKSKDTSSITVNVTGSDGSGSGIVKYECKATTQSTWYQQDTNGNCKVTGLSEGTSYTIEGRVTDASGRVSAENRANTTTQTTETSYTCSIGTRVYDASKGSSSGGYICTTSASSRGWYSTSTYWKCSYSDTHYGSQSTAESYCEAGNTSCETIEDQDFYCPYDGKKYRGYSALLSGCKFSTYCRRYGDGGAWGDYHCFFQDSSGIEHDGGGYGNGTYDDCISGCNSQSFLDSGYRCPYDGQIWSDNYRCYSGCTRPAGTVTSGTESSNYYCGSGWTILSGSGSSLQCYRAATKG